MKKVLLLLVLVVCCSASFSQTGVLDQTFGVGGKVVTLPAHYSDGSRAVALQSSGKIIVVGNSGIFSGNGFAVRRFNANGSIDSTFGVNGIAGKAINVNDGASCIAIQSDDKILLGGSTNSYMSGETYFVIIRFKADGIIDSSFGYNGISTANFSYTTENRDNLVDLFIKSNGKILACGSSGDGFSGTGGFALTQLNPDGLVDTTFGQRGQVLIDTFQFGNISSILQPDGKIVSGGYRSKRFSSVSSFALLRFTANGHIDSTFGNNGFSLDTLAGFSVTDAILQPDGKIVFAGNYQNYSGITLARFQSSGLLDVTFGSGGIAKSIIRDSSFYGVGASQLLLDLSGKILIAGTIRQDFLLARTNNDGTRDYNFGKRGIIATDINGYNDWASGAVIQQDGKVIVAGSSGNGTNTSSFSLVRYESNALVKYNTIVGNAFLDNNSNGIKDSGEHLFPYADFMVASSHPDTTILNGAFGKFMLDVDTGNYATTVLPYLPYYNTAPLSYNSLFGSYFNTDSFSFAMQPIPGKRDLMIQLFALNNARPGFPLLYKIVYKNEGTDTVNGTIVFIKNPKVQYDSASTTANSVIADTTKWNFINLKPLQTKSIIAYLKVLTPPAVTVGDTLLLSVKIESTGNELTPTNNLSTLRQVVKNSFDPQR